MKEWVYYSLKAITGTITANALLETYFYEYFEVLHRYAYTILKDNDEAKDVVQSVFVQLWAKKDIIYIKQSARAYLYTATYNRSLNYLRNTKKRKQHETGAATIVRDTYDLQEEIESREIKQEILHAMKALPEKCREVFYKNRFEEKTYAEIAAELQISIKTVESQMSKALNILRTSLSRNAEVMLLIWFLTDSFTQLTPLV